MGKATPLHLARLANSMDPLSSSYHHYHHGNAHASFSSCPYHSQHLHNRVPKSPSASTAILVDQNPEALYSYLTGPTEIFRPAYDPNSPSSARPRHLSDFPFDDAAMQPPPSRQDHHVNPRPLDRFFATHASHTVVLPDFPRLQHPRPEDDEDEVDEDQDMYDDESGDSYPSTDEDPDEYLGGASTTSLGPREGYIEERPLTQEEWAVSRFNPDRHYRRHQNPSFTSNSHRDRQLDLEIGRELSMFGDRVRQPSSTERDSLGRMMMRSRDELAQTRRDLEEEVDAGAGVVATELNEEGRLSPMDLDDFRREGERSFARVMGMLDSRERYLLAGEGAEEVEGAFEAGGPWS